MTRLDRILKLLERYDSLIECALKAYHHGQFGWTLLSELRTEKEKLTQELIEHGCRRTINEKH